MTTNTDFFCLKSRYLPPDQIAEAKIDVKHFALDALIFTLFTLLLSMVPDSLPWQHFGIAALFMLAVAAGFGALSLWYLHLIRVTQAMIGGEPSAA